MNNRKNFTKTGALLILFLIFTVLVMKVDFRPIGPENSSVGLATINQFVHEKIGVHNSWYNITEGLGILAIVVAFGFAILGMVQMLKRKSLFKVDQDIILLGLYFAIVIVAYVFFDKFIINYRPIIMEKGLEASYPSSHAMIISSIMGAAMIQFHNRIRNKSIRNIVQIISAGIIILVVVGRLISGVHWFTDIIGGVLLSGVFISLYYSLYKL